jgi:DNA-binding XRE family transcriptional regulator
MFDAKEYLEGLADHRKQRFTQHEIAVLLGISQPTLSALERGVYPWKREWFKQYCSIIDATPLPDHKNPIRFASESAPRVTCPLSVPLTVEQREQLSRMAKMVGVSKAEFVRQALDVMAQQLLTDDVNIPAQSES